MTGFGDHLNKALERERSIFYPTFRKTASFKPSIPEGLETMICSDIWHSYRATPLVKDPRTLAMIHRYLVSHAS